jgi:hypothetical protein
MRLCRRAGWAIGAMAGRRWGITGGMTDPTYSTDSEPTEPPADEEPTAGRVVDEERAPDAGSPALGGAGFGVVGPEDVDDDPGVGDAV